MTQSDALSILKLGENVFLTGAPGAGKTYVLNQYIAFLESKEVNVAVTAYTGIAASHINGRTLHSWAGLTWGINKDGNTGTDAENEEAERKRIRKNKYLSGKVNAAKVLIIDEISMLHPAEFDRVDFICRAARNSSEPFGGLQLICCGDFFQIPPVNQQDNQFVLDSAAWKNAAMRVCYLHEQHRHGDAQLLGILDAIRHGKVTSEIVSLLQSRVNKPVAASIGIARLYTHRENVDEINLGELRKLKEDEVIYEVNEFGPTPLIEKLKRDNGVDRFILKVGARVMFTKNNMSAGYVNGTLGEVIGFAGNEAEAGGVTQAEVVPIIMTFDKKQVSIARHTYKIEENGKTKAFVSQVPLKLAWAITVHKSQGMTLDAAEIDLGRAFDRGMGYVALSRVRKLENISLIGFNTMALQVSKRVQFLDLGFLSLSADSEKFIVSLSADEKTRAQDEFLARITSSGTPGGSKGGSAADDFQLDYSAVDELPVLDF
jgi:hypothetical protein